MQAHACIAARRCIYVTRERARRISADRFTHPRAAIIRGYVCGSVNEGLSGQRCVSRLRLPALNSQFMVTVMGPNVRPHFTVCNSVRKTLLHYRASNMRDNAMKSSASWFLFNPPRVRSYIYCPLISRENSTLNLYELHER